MSKGVALDTRPPEVVQSLVTTPTLTLCMITRDTGAYIARCLASVSQYVQEVIVVDTGSVDNTKQEILRVCPHARVVDYTISTNPEGFLRDESATWKDQIPGPFSGLSMLGNFAGARQKGWDLATSDYVLWIDSDDVVENAQNLPALLVNLRETDVDAALLNYDYHTDASGRVTCKLTRERIFKKGFAHWAGDVHECLVPIGRGTFYDSVNIVHKRHEYPGVSSGVAHRNLKILTSWFAKQTADPDPRMLFYLASEERFMYPDRAVEHFKKYCQVSGWDEERAVAHIMSGRLHEHFGRYDDAFVEYSQASVDFWRNPDGLFGCARVAYFKHDNSKIIEYTERAFKLIDSGEEMSMLMHDPQDRSYKPYIYYSAALINARRWDEAFNACNKGLQINPEDPYLKGNKLVAEGNLRPQETAGFAKTLKLDESLDSPSTNHAPQVLEMFAITLWKKLREEGRRDHAHKFLGLLPDSVHRSAKIQQALRMSLTDAVPTRDARRHIVIWTGWAYEPWSPSSLDAGGIGGSETAAIHMARELHNLGHKVTVLNDCAGKAGNYDGVEYVHFQEGLDRPEKFACDVLVVSRHAQILNHPFPAKKRVLWVHDIHVGQHDISKADFVLCLSTWHREFFASTYPAFPAHRILTTRNGLDVSRFAAEPVKQGQRLIYASSPDRGLERLLGLFPRIRAMVHDCELHVYYGFENWEKAAQNDEGQRATIQRIKQALQQPGVTFHGRVGQRELAAAYLSAKVWAYPTWFCETFCLSALEAQAAGCVPVTTDLAALHETVTHGHLLAPPNTSEEYGTAFVNKVVELLRFKDLAADIVRANTLHTAGWDRVARDWENLFFETAKVSAVVDISAFSVPYKAVMI